MKLRILALILCLTLIFSNSVIFAAAPAEDLVEPAASYLIVDYLGFITDNGDGDITVVYDISAKYTIEKLGADQIEVQRYDGSKWVFAATVYATSYNDLVKDDTGSVLDGYDFSDLDVGGTYRAVIVFYAKNGSIEETRTYATDSVKLVATPG